VISSRAASPLARVSPPAPQTGDASRAVHSRGRAELDTATPVQNVDQEDHH